MVDAKIEGVGVPVPVSGVVESVTATSSSPADLVEALRRVHVFSDLPDDQLKWFAENVRDERFAAGDILFRKGDPPDWMAVFLEGEMHAYRDDNAHEGYVYISKAGDPASEVTGVLPFSRMTQFTVTGRAAMASRILRFPVQLFPELLQRMPILAKRLVGIMSDRVRETTTADQQQDKLMALGKLSAGLAHELNNPAAGANRAANDLILVLAELRAADLRLCRHELTVEQEDAISTFENAALEHSATTRQLNSLEQSDREDLVASWLEDHGVADPWKLSGNLVEAGIDAEALQRISAGLDEKAFADVVARVNAQLAAAKLASEIKAATSRISELVGAIKEYSYMDQASVQEVDLNKSLVSTLLILKYKLKRKNIVVTRDYDEELPRIKAYGSELNQVWTNLIVNAVDAMSEGGTLKVRTKKEPTDILVEIRDNGPGIPPDLRSRIFEPFFTTKPVGEGTGLGLDTVARIVRKHRGNIRFESKPGDTCFQVRLPLDLNSGHETVPTPTTNVENR
ncbi:MAG TPA: ATP-binding protein [Pyrinomonadaceae bacterium]|jgi:Signal transduction histidine kinase|nr:ATP-binding protein [Pyrinomonadaceae bacterium]